LRRPRVRLLLRRNTMYTLSRPWRTIISLVSHNMSDEDTSAAGVAAPEAAPEAVPAEEAAPEAAPAEEAAPEAPAPEAGREAGNPEVV
jgi:hypothetical protein